MHVRIFKARADEELRLLNKKTETHKAVPREAVAEMEARAGGAADHRETEPPKEVVL
jgi:hypothetical protein